MDIKNIKDLYNIINKSDEELINYLQGVNLIRNVFRCKQRTCRVVCSVTKKKGCSSLNHFFRCKRCRRAYSIFSGTFFSNVKLPIRDVLLVMWYWSCETRSGCVSMITGLTSNCVVQLYRYFRDILSWKLLQEDDLFTLGKLIY